MKMNLVFTETEIVSDTLRKIAIMTEQIPVDSIDAVFGSVQATMSCRLNGEGCDFVSHWNEEKKEMMCHVWDGAAPVGKFDWHPLNESREFDEVAFATGYIQFINGQ